MRSKIVTHDGKKLLTVAYAGEEDIDSKDFYHPIKDNKKHQNTVHIFPQIYALNRDKKLFKYPFIFYYNSIL